MDRRTTSLLDALSHPGGAILAALLGGDATEAQLAVQIDAPQPTVHRRLQMLEQLGIVVRPAGRWRAPNRPYRVAVPDEIEALLVAAAAVSAALAAAEDRARREMLADLQRGRRAK